MDDSCARGIGLTPEWSADEGHDRAVAQLRPYPACRFGAQTCSADPHPCAPKGSDYTRIIMLSLRPLITLVAAAFCLIAAPPCAAQVRQVPPPPGTPRPELPKAPVAKVRDGVYKVGLIEVDTTKGQLSVPAQVNQGVTTLEFVANTKDGAKSYESAVTVHADAVMFNAALLLLGLDPKHSRAPRRHFDPETPRGDAVELFMEWPDLSSTRIRVEELLFDERTKKTMEEGPWVYTASTPGAPGRLMAETDGVLIGFVHSPAPLIENPRKGAVGAFGSVVLNPKYRTPRPLGRLVVKTVIAKK